MSGPNKRVREGAAGTAGGARAHSPTPPPGRHHVSALLALLMRRRFTIKWPIIARPLLDWLPLEDARALAAAFDPPTHAAPTLLDVAWIVAKRGYAADVWRCCGICREMWRWIEPELSEEDAARVRRDHPFWQAIINLPHGEWGRTRLMQAALVSEMRLARVKELIAWHANVNLTNNDGWTALIHACFGGHVEAVRALLDAGADVNAADIRGWTVLMYASYVGNRKVLETLLFRGANKHLVARNGTTALSIALDNPFGSEEVRALLLDPDIAP